MSPWAPLRPCATPNCPERVPRGHCAAHRRQREAYRGSSASRGYDHKWVLFRRYFVSLLLEANIPPVCGAALPGGPDTKEHSRCHQDGLQNGHDLHLDHEPPLSEAEREAARHGDRRAVDDAMRCSFLCRSCHASKGLQQNPRRPAWIDRGGLGMIPSDWLAMT
jgi:hypothetical protein